MTRIDIPTWAQPFELDIEVDFAQTEYQKIVLQRDYVLGLVQLAVQNYVDENQHDKKFSLKNLNGDFYIQSESYRLYTPSECPKETNPPLEHWFSVMTHCLEHKRFEHPNQDYLGLEVHLQWRPDDMSIIHYGDVDSSSI